MIIVISSRSGGVGKSSTAIHLSAYLSTRRGAGKVALVDLDANETCLEWHQSGPGQKFDVLGPDDEPDGYDHLIIDTAAAPDSDELAEILEASDLLVIPTTPSPFDVKPAIATSETFDLKEGDVTLLLTLCPPLPSRVGADSLQAIKDAGIPVVSQLITRRNVYLDAAIGGLHVGQIKKKPAQKAWAEWQAVGKEIFRGRL